MSQNTLPEKRYRGTFIERLRHAARVARRGLQAGLMIVAVAGPVKILQWHFARKHAAGEMIWLDDFTV